MFRSPTCTIVDKMAAEKLAEIAELNIKEFGLQMFRAGSNLKNKLPEEIFYHDYKKFVLGDINLGVGQITSLDEDELINIKEKLVTYLDKAYKEHGMNIICFMLTNIITESTEVIFVGNDAKELIEDAFDVVSENNCAVLKGVVSRKKQFIPAIFESINGGK